jgi:putative membrane protein insertion efficiency factor
MSIIKKVGIETALVPVKFYQHVISPLTPASCRHIPTCSEYAHQAIRRYGIIDGGKLAANRFGRCHPWGTHGWDPVPVILIKKMKVNKRIQKAERVNYEGDEEY